MAMSGASAMSDRISAATDQPRLPLSESRTSLRRKEAGSGGWPLAACWSAPVSDPALAAGGLARHERRHGLLRQALIRLLKRIGEGVGRVDHGVD